MRVPTTLSVSPNRCDACVFLSFSRGRRTLNIEVFYAAALVQIWDRATIRNRGRIVKLVIYGRIVVAVLIGEVLGKFIFSALVE